MGIVPTFDSSTISDRVKDFQSRVEKATIFQLKYLGEGLVTYAKEMRNYTDRTGNLTNSIGYAVVRNTEIVASDGDSKFGEGAENAIRILHKYADQCSNTYTLIVVAGMNYAAYVEAKGYNVILPAELKCQVAFPQTILKIQKMAQEKAKHIFGI